MVLSLSAAVGLSAQSLAEVARKEQERRKRVSIPSKVYTNDDLRRLPGDAPKGASKSGPNSAPKPTADPAAAAKPAAGAEKPPAPDPAAPAVKDENYWRGRITQARDSIQRNETFRDALQSRINALSADFVNRDDPAQRAAIAFDRQKAIAELDRVQSEIQQQTQQITTIEDEARRAGVPPGWLR